MTTSAYELDTDSVRMIHPGGKPRTTASQGELPVTRGEPTLTVSELNERVRAVLQAQFPRQVWVRGEIQDYDRRKDRPTVSFTLAEKHPESDDVLASVTAIMFPPDRQAIEGVLQRAENAFQLQDGIEVRFQVEVGFWAKGGRFQLRVCGIDPTYTLGRMAQNRQRIIELLTKRGLLERNKRLTMPLVPLRIGLVAAKGSAGLTDFITHLRESALAFSIQFVPAAMQGPNVELEVSAAIRHFNRVGGADVVVLVRGGGAEADLSWFDRLGLAEAIATSRIPVLTGLGHTHNVSVADLVAYANLKTPTDVAQYLIDAVRAFLAFLTERFVELAQRLERLLQEEATRLRDVGEAVAETANQLVFSSSVWLADRSRGMLSCREVVLAAYRQGLGMSRQRLSLQRIRQLLQHARGELGQGRRRMAQRAMQLIARRAEELAHRREAYTYPRLARLILRERQWLTRPAPTLRRSTEHALANSRVQIQGAGEQIRALDPVKTLKRGFSILRNASGSIVARVADVHVGDDTMTQVSDGLIRSHVRSTEPRPQPEDSNE